MEERPLMMSENPRKAELREKQTSTTSEEKKTLEEISMADWVAYRPIAIGSSGLWGVYFTVLRVVAFGIAIFFTIELPLFYTVGSWMAFVFLSNYLDEFNWKSCAEVSPDEKILVARFPKTQKSKERGAASVISHFSPMHFASMRGLFPQTSLGTATYWVVALFPFGVILPVGLFLTLMTSPLLAVGLVLLLGSWITQHAFQPAAKSGQTTATLEPEEGPDNTETVDVEKPANLDLEDGPDNNPMKFSYETVTHLLGTEDEQDSEEGRKRVCEVCAWLHTILMVGLVYAVYTDSTNGYNYDSVWNQLDGVAFWYYLACAGLNIVMSHLLYRQVLLKFMTVVAVINSARRRLNVFASLTRNDSKAHTSPFDLDIDGSALLNIKEDKHKQLVNNQVAELKHPSETTWHKEGFADADITMLNIVILNVRSWMLMRNYLKYTSNQAAEVVETFIPMCVILILIFAGVPAFEIYSSQEWHFKNNDWTYMVQKTIYAQHLIFMVAMLTRCVGEVAQVNAEFDSHSKTIAANRVRLLLRCEHFLDEKARSKIADLMNMMSTWYQTINEVEKPVAVMGMEVTGKNLIRVATILGSAAFVALRKPLLDLVLKWSTCDDTEGHEWVNKTCGVIASAAGHVS